MGDDTPDQSAGTQRMSKAREGQIRDYAEAMVLTEIGRASCRERV